MLHLIWYIIVGLIAGVVAKHVMHMHMTLLWTSCSVSSVQLLADW
jgi:uncharacterized membrane protein YeaQ/YmgE (transglycosylase-associated protein family)